MHGADIVLLAQNDQPFHNLKKYKSVDRQILRSTELSIEALKWRKVLSGAALMPSLVTYPVDG